MRRLPAQLLTAEGRQVFRERLPVGETAWACGRGWALWKTLATCGYTLGNDDQEAATALDAADVRRDFHTAMRGAEGTNPKNWTTCELRHSFE